MLIATLSIWQKSIDINKNEALNCPKWLYSIS